MRRLGGTELTELELVTTMPSDHCLERRGHSDDLVTALVTKQLRLIRVGRGERGRAGTAPSWIRSEVFSELLLAV
jgi:hypothetical protein